MDFGCGGGAGVGVIVFARGGRGGGGDFRVVDSFMQDVTTGGPRKVMESLIALVGSAIRVCMEGVGMQSEYLEKE